MRVRGGLRSVAQFAVTLDLSLTSWLHLEAHVATLAKHQGHRSQTYGDSWTSTHGIFGQCLAKDHSSPCLPETLPNASREQLWLLGHIICKKRFHRCQNKFSSAEHGQSPPLCFRPVRQISLYIYQNVPKAKVNSKIFNSYEIQIFMKWGLHKYCKTTTLYENLLKFTFHTYLTKIRYIAAV